MEKKKSTRGQKERNKVVEYLISTKGCEEVECANRKYRQFKIPNQIVFYFVGQSGALRKGKSASSSKSLTAQIKETLANIEVVAKESKPTSVVKTEETPKPVNAPKNGKKFKMGSRPHALFAQMLASKTVDECLKNEMLFKEVYGGNKSWIVNDFKRLSQYM